MKDDIIFCENGGCGAKLGSKSLSKVLSKLPKAYDKNLLVGFESSDDASVYKVSDDIAIVNTLDFFPPMIEDPYIFGQIAAANALSDIYAMGADFKTALNIVCFPKDLDLNILGKVLLGGSDKVIEAGGVLVGGHSINDESLKYGLSASGTIHPNKILRNNTCIEDDALILTKPLGVGIIFNAKKKGIASDIAINKAVKSMTTLNKDASLILRKYDIHSCTDVTGFSLLGHLSETLSNNYSAILNSKDIPIFSEAVSYAQKNCITGGSIKIKENLENNVEHNIDKNLLEVLYDPQTSGGLLFTIKEKEANKILKELRNLQLEANIIGKIIKKSNKKIYIN